MVLGFDLGLATCGWTAAELNKDEGAELVDLGFIGTEKSSKKRNVGAASDEWRRAQELWRALADQVRYFQPSVLLAEEKSLPRHASAAGKVSMAWGVLAALAASNRLPLVTKTPQEIRHYFEVPKGGSKTDVQRAVMVTVPGMMSLLKKKGLNKADSVHPVDAVAATWACLESEIVRAVRPR